MPNKSIVNAKNSKINFDENPDLFKWNGPQIRDYLCRKNLIYPVLIIFLGKNEIRDNYC